MVSTRITRGGLPLRGGNRHHRGPPPKCLHHPVLIRLGDRLERVTELVETYHGKNNDNNQKVLRALCGEASLSEDENGWSVVHYNNGTGSSDNSGTSTCIAVLKHRKKQQPPLRLVQSLLMAGELNHWLDIGSQKNDRRRRRLCVDRDGVVMDVTDLVADVPAEGMVTALISKLSKNTNVNIANVCGAKEYQGWTIEKPTAVSTEQHALSKRRNDSVSSNDETDKTLPTSSMSSVASSASSTWSMANQLLSNVKDFMSSLQGSGQNKSECSNHSFSPNAKRRKMTHVSFANSKPIWVGEEKRPKVQTVVDDASEKRRRLRSNKSCKGKQAKKKVRVVSPPAMELSSESDITTDDEHHSRDEEDDDEDEVENRNATYDEQYKVLSDTLDHDDEDDDEALLALNTVKVRHHEEHAQQSYRTRRTQPRRSAVSDEVPRRTTRSSGKRNRGSEKEEKEENDIVMIPITKGPPIRRVRIMMKGMGALGTTEARIGKEGIPERRQTRAAHGVHVEAPARFIEVDSNQGFPSSFRPHPTTDVDTLLRNKKEKTSVAAVRTARTRRPNRMKKHEDESPVRRNVRGSRARADSYEEPNEDQIYELEEAAIQEEEYDKEEGYASGTVPSFVLDTSNKLSVARLVSEYEDICVNKHDSCSSLKNFYSDEETAKDAVLNLLEEVEDLNKKYNRRKKEDEDIIAERQLAGRSMRTMQGRMNQEIIVRMQEKEQAELLALEIAYQRKDRKRHAMTINEMEWEEIQNRPVHFATTKARNNSRSNGSTSCPCAPKSTRRSATRAEETAPCYLCQDPDRNDKNKLLIVQDKNLVPRFRTIDVDAPDFVDRDVDEDALATKKGVSKDSKPARKARGSNRLRNDSRMRLETTMKLQEMKHSIDFIEDYNTGLIEEKLKECKK